MKTAPTGGPEPPSLQQCTSALKRLSTDNLKLSPKDHAKLYTAAIGFLVHLKQDQRKLYEAWDQRDGAKAFPPPEEIPAVTSLQEDSRLFQAVIIMLCPRAGHEHDHTARLGLHSLKESIEKPSVTSVSDGATTGESKSRKRAYSISSADEGSELPYKIQKVGRPFSGSDRTMAQNRPTFATDRTNERGMPPPSGKGMSLPLPVLAAAIFYSGYRHVDHWPSPLIHAYAEDCFGPRSWVGDKRCRDLVDNLAFAHKPDMPAIDEKTAIQAEKVAEFYFDIESWTKQLDPPEAPPPVDNGGGSGGRTDMDTDDDQTVDSTNTPFRRFPPMPAEPASIAGRQLSNQSGIETIFNDDSSSSGDEEVLMDDSGFGDEGSIMREMAPPSKTSDTGSVPKEVSVETTSGSSISQEKRVSKYPLKVNKADMKRSRPRFVGLNLEIAHDLIAESLSRRLNTKTKQNSGLLAVLQGFTSIPRIRIIIARHLSKWLQSPAIAGLARKLFSLIVKSMRSVEPPLVEDLETINAILSMEIKANQLSFHIENVSAIARNMPTSEALRHILVHLFTNDLKNADEVKDASSSNSMRIFRQVHAVVSSELAWSGMAAAVLTVTLNTNSEKSNAELSERRQSLLLAKTLVGRIASVLGSSFDGTRFVKALIECSSEATTCKQHLEIKARIIFVGMTLCTPSVLSEKIVLAKKKPRKQPSSELQEEIILPSSEASLLRDALMNVRKGVLRWCCSVYAPNASGPKNDSGVKEKQRNGNVELVGAGTPDFSSVLDGYSPMKEESPLLLAMKCLLLLVGPNDPKLSKFVFADASNDAFTHEERQQIRVCNMYGRDLDDELLWIILQSTNTAGGSIPGALSLSLIESMFKECARERAGSFRVTDRKLVWEMYKLTEYNFEKESTQAEAKEAERHKSPKNYETLLLEHVKKAVSTYSNCREEPRTVDRSDLPRLAYPGLWWRVTALTLIMCGVSPEKIGMHVWDEHPTVRSIIKMTTSGKYRFPTVDSDERQRELMKKGEADLRDEETKAAEVLFLPKSSQSKKQKTESGKAIPPLASGSRSRASARQQEKQARLMRRQKEKEEMEARAEERRVKKLLKTAQKSIMVMDPHCAARKPPRESVELLLSADRMFDLSNFFRQCSQPDFLLYTIGQTSRDSIERANEWLIPIISSHPQIITRLPASASCFLLLSAFGSDSSEKSQITKLTAPLLSHIQSSLSGAFGKENSVRAAELLLADISDSNPVRRSAARRVLQETVGKLDGSPQQTSDSVSDSEWLFSLTSLPHAVSFIERAIQLVSDALAYERGRILRDLVVALHQFVGFAESNSIPVPIKFSSIFCELMSNRPSACAEAMQRFRDFRDLALREIHSSFIDALADNDSECTDKITIVLPASDEKTNIRKKVFMSVSLLRAILVLISNWHEQVNASLEKTKTAAFSSKEFSFLVNQMLHPPKFDESSDGVHAETGAASARYHDSEKCVVTVEEWVMLAKSRSDFVAKQAALSAPASCLPRLLLCSGLPGTSLATMIDRLGKLGAASEDTGKCFSKLLMPSTMIQGSFGGLYNRHEVARKLLGRLSAHIKMQQAENTLDESISMEFLKWLTLECNANDKARRKKSAKKTGVSMLQSAISTKFDLGEIVAQPGESKCRFLSKSKFKYRPMLMDRIRSSPSSPSTTLISDGAKAFVSQCFASGRISVLENELLQFNRNANVQARLVSIPRDATLIEDCVFESDGAVVAVELLSAFFECKDNTNAANVVLRWVPLLTQCRGMSRLWRIIFGLELARSAIGKMVVSRCEVVWDRHHVHSCQQWILSQVDCKEELARLHTQFLLRFLVNTSSAQFIQSDSFWSPQGETLGFVKSDDHIAAVVVLAMEVASATKQRGEHLRNCFPDWLHLLLLVARVGNQQLRSVVTRILKSKGQDVDDNIIFAAVLRLYSYYAPKLNLSDSNLRGCLLDAVTMYAQEWPEWRCVLDDHMSRVTTSFFGNPSQRNALAMCEFGKKHPLIILRSFNKFASHLHNDCSGCPSSTTETQRIDGQQNMGVATAKIGKAVLRVRARHWGYSFSEQLWLSTADVWLAVPKQVLYRCGVKMGFLLILELFIKLLLVQQDIMNEKATEGLKQKVTAIISDFKQENEPAFMKWSSEFLPYKQMK